MLSTANIGDWLSGYMILLGGSCRTCVSRLCRSREFYSLHYTAIIEDGLTWMLMLFGGCRCCLVGRLGGGRSSCHGWVR